MAEIVNMPKLGFDMAEGTLIRWVISEQEAVEKGQVVCQMGLSFSPENGGHGAHDHFGMYTGGYSDKHNYGRTGTDHTKEDWLVPAEFLTPRVDGEELKPDSYR